MPDFAITPADSPDLMCNFTVPRTGKDALAFAVRRLDYVADFDLKWAKWIGERMTPNEKDDLGKDVPREMPSNREVIVEQLRLAGVTAAVCKELNKLTNGELNQIFEAWESASKVAVGESAPSDS